MFTFLCSSRLLTLGNLAEYFSTYYWFRCHYPYLTDNYQGLFSKLDPSLVLRFFSCLLIILLYNKEPTEINRKIRISYWFDKNQSKLGFYGQKLEEIDRWFNLIWTFFSYKLIRWLRDQLKTGIYVNRFESVFIKWILNNLKKK